MEVLKRIQVSSKPSASSSEAHVQNIGTVLYSSQRSRHSRHAAAQAMQWACWCLPHSCSQALHTAMHCCSRAGVCDEFRPMKRAVMVQISAQSRSRRMHSFMWATFDSSRQASAQFSQAVMHFIMLSSSSLVFWSFMVCGCLVRTPPTPHASGQGSRYTAWGRYRALRAACGHRGVAHTARTGEQVAQYYFLARRSRAVAPQALFAPGHKGIRHRPLPPSHHRSAQSGLSTRGMCCPGIRWLHWASYAHFV